MQAAHVWLPLSDALEYGTLPHQHLLRQSKQRVTAPMCHSCIPAPLQARPPAGACRSYSLTRVGEHKEVGV
jgi:hypothetical protein